MNRTSEYELTIVVPVYNEEDNMERLEKELSAFLPKAAKNLQSKIANGFRRKMTGDTATETGCPLQVMWTDYAKQLPFFDGMHRFLPALMILVDGKFCEMPVQHFPRIAGVSKYHLYNRLVSPFMDCFAYRWMKKRFIRYDIDQTNTGLNIVP